MGLFKQMKDMKGMVEDAPAMIRNAQALGAQAQQMAAAQQAASQAQAAAAAAQLQVDAAPGGAHAADYEPISGVSLELYAEIAKGLAAVGYDQARGPEIAATHGVSADSWQAAVDGWNGRIKGSPQVAGRFNAFYTGEGVMGFFKSIRETTQLSREISKDWDPGQQRRDGMARMAAAQEMMAQTTRAANIAATGVAATATVTAATQTGAMINMEPVVELSLTVIPASGLPPYPATLRQPINQLLLPLVGVGSTLSVKVDAADPQSIWIDFATQPA